MEAREGDSLLGLLSKAWPLRAWAFTGAALLTSAEILDEVSEGPE